jgi:hypothetical protein
MKLKITRSHITADGPVAPGTVVDMQDHIAVDYLNAKLAVPHKEETVEKATNKKPKETAKTK